MMQKILTGRGTINELTGILDNKNLKSVFLVTGKSSFITSGARDILFSLLANRKVFQFNDFEVNPQLDDIAKGIDLFKQSKSDCIIAVGGGSVIDMAKAIRALSGLKNAKIADAVIFNHVHQNNIPLIAIPTTLGSGSESTSFAVVYINKNKYSLSHSSVLPDLAVIDTSISESLPPSVTIINAFDALSQALEALWSINSNWESDEYATEAVKTIWRILPYLSNPTKLHKHQLAIAANLSGRAINITKTTAPHALSYYFTSHLNLPHGHAVALFLPIFIIYNNAVQDHDCNDKRGYLFVQKRMSYIIKLLACDSAEKAGSAIRNIAAKLNLELDFGNLNISRNILVDALCSFNAERMKNNPRCFNAEELINNMNQYFHV